MKRAEIDSALVFSPAKTPTRSGGTSMVSSGQVSALWAALPTPATSSAGSTWPMVWTTSMNGVATAISTMPPAMTRLRPTRGWPRRRQREQAGALHGP